MTAEQLIKVLLELDQQVVSPRPSAWGRAAELVAALCDEAEQNFWDDGRLGDWRDVDLSGVRSRSPSELNQPTLDAIRGESGGLPIARMVKDAGEAGKLAEGLSLHSEERVYLGDLSCHVFALAERVRELEAEREAARASSEMMIGGMDTLILEDRNKAEECDARVRALEGELTAARSGTGVPGCMVPNPLTGQSGRVQNVLRQMAAQENRDGDPWDQMQAAAEYIDRLEGELKSAKDFGATVAPREKPWVG